MNLRNGPTSCSSAGCILRLGIAMPTLKMPSLFNFNKKMKDLLK